MCLNPLLSSHIKDVSLLMLSVTLLAQVAEVSATGSKHSSPDDDACGFF